MRLLTAALLITFVHFLNAIEDLPSSWKPALRPLNQMLDPVLHSIPPGIPEALVHPYFTRPDFAPTQTASEMHIGKTTSTFGLYTGKALRDIDVLERMSPMGPEGPLRYKDSPYLTPLIRKPEEPFKFHFSGIDNPYEEDFGDVGNFRAERMRQLSMGMDEKLAGSSLPNMVSNVAPRAIHLYESRHLQALGAGADMTLTHPDDLFLLAQANQPPPAPPAGITDAVMSAAAAAGEGGGGGVIRVRTGFEPERQQVMLRVVREPSMMHLEKAAGWERQPFVDRGVGPVITGGICIGIRCSDGVLLAADTMIMFGSTKKAYNVRRLHKVTDRIVIAAEGEYADFQEIQTMLMDLVQDHVEIPPYGYHEIEPFQAFHFLSQVMYARRTQMEPLYNAVLVAGWGKNLDMEDGMPLYMHTQAKEEGFLGSVDMHGTAVKSHILATSIGTYMAMPLLRRATDEVENMMQGKCPKALTLKQARVVACDVMRILSLRTSQCSNRIQLATVSGEEGVEITEPFYLDSKWNTDGFHPHEFGTNLQKEDFFMY